MAIPVVLVLRGILKRPDNRFLLLKRSSRSKSWPGKWEFPGGKVDRGENPDDALRREFLEETALSVGPQELFRDFFWEREKDRIHYKIFFVKYLSGEVKISDEHDNSGWFSLDEIKSMDISSPLLGIMKLLEKL
ncbi:MAG: NUDIX domain-containing protein [Candidatus Omnitrophica bacterium]|nr:NUDIX domain-containing protein [Candidatus Omnitrophota bacterium]